MSTALLRGRQPSNDGGRADCQGREPTTDALPSTPPPVTCRSRHRAQNRRICMWSAMRTVPSPSRTKSAGSISQRGRSRFSCVAVFACRQASRGGHHALVTADVTGPAGGGPVNRAEPAAGAGGGRWAATYPGWPGRRPGFAAAAYGAGTLFLWWGWDGEVPVISRGRIASEFVRCPGVRGPAQARPEGVRGPLAGRGLRQVPVVHDAGAGRQLPRRAGPRGAPGPGFRPGDR